MVMTSRTQLTSIRLPIPLRRQLEFIAHQNQQSVAAAAIDVLQQALSKTPVDPQSAASPAFFVSEN